MTIFAAMLMLANPVAAAAPSEAGDTSQAQTPAAPGAPAQTQAVEEKLTCKSEEVLGTRMKKRICKTRADWDEDARITREEVENAKRNSHTPDR